MNGSMKDCDETCAAPSSQLFRCTPIQPFPVKGKVPIRSSLDGEDNGGVNKSEATKKSKGASQWLKIGLNATRWVKSPSPLTVIGARRHNVLSNTSRRVWGGTRCREKSSRRWVSLKRLPR